MCCIAEIAMFVFGIIALVMGKFSLTRSRVVHKVPARIIGVILLLPLIVGGGTSVLIVFVKGVQVGAQGKEFSMQDAMKLEGPIAVLNVGSTGICLRAVIIIAIATAKPPKSKKRRLREEEDDDEDYDDRPRRHSNGADEEDDDRPRRRARNDDDDDDNRPRRRSRDDDDDDDRPRRRPPDDRIRER